MMVVYLVRECSGSRWDLVILLVIGLLLVKLDSVAGYYNCTCTCTNSTLCTDCSESENIISWIIIKDRSEEVTLNITNCTVVCNCNETFSCPSNSNAIAAAVLVPLFLEALIIGGVIASILLWKWRRKLITSWPTLKTYVEHTLHNPTYGAEDYPTSPTCSTPSAQDTVGPSDLYEEISEELLNGTVDNKTNDTVITSCYACVAAEPPPTPPESECKVESNTATRSATVTPNSQAAQKSQQIIQGHDDKSIAGAPPVTAYAVTSIAVKSKRTSRSFSSDVNKATRPSDNTSRHFSEGFKAPLNQHKRKKPKPAPMPKELRELTVMKRKAKPQSKAGVNNQQKFSLSAVDPESEKYSKLNPKTQYMGLEPHIGSNGKGKKKKAEVKAPKEEYSHLKH